MKSPQINMRKWQRHLPDFWLITEAACLSLLVRLILQIIPFRWLARRLGARSPGGASPKQNQREVDLKKIGWVAEATSRKFGWRNPCLVSAIVAKFMLRRRAVIGSQLVLGVKKDEEYKLVAHAWLKIGEVIVTGGTHSNQYVALTSFTG